MGPTRPSLRQIVISPPYSFQGAGRPDFDERRLNRLLNSLDTQLAKVPPLVRAPCTNQNDSRGWKMTADTDDESATVAHGIDETVVVFDMTPTAAVAELAWSRIDDIGDAATEHYSWAATWFNAAMLIACAAILAAGLGFGVWAWLTSHNHAAAKPVSQAPTSAIAAQATAGSAVTTSAPAPSSSGVAAEPPAALTPSATVPLEAESQDARFMAMLEQRGITFKSGPGAIKAAHAVCKLISGGSTPDQLAPQVAAQNPGLTIPFAATFVDFATSVYCPR